jgi:hypothetical protein
MVDRKCAMKGVKTNGIGADASSAVPKPCGRCGTAIGKNEFCPACTEFFHALSRWKVVFTTDIRTPQRR